MLRYARQRGLWVLCVDTTFVGHQGQATQNTFSHGNTRARAKKSQPQQRRYHRRRCHGFVMGLLISPEGLRLPLVLSYYTRDYGQQKGYTYRTQAQLDADLIREVEVPEGVELFVVADTAFDSKDVRKACAQRGFHWLVPINPERVLAQPKPRPKVRQLIPHLSEGDYTEIRLFPHRAEQRRLSSGRRQRKRQRRYFIHTELQSVHSVGDVRLVFSKTQRSTPGESIPEVKILMSDCVGRSARELVEIYALRWQIETGFQQLTDYLRCEVESLGYPRAALFAFALAVVAYNVLALVRAALARVRGWAAVREGLSSYYLAREWSRVYGGMRIAVEPTVWAAWEQLSPGAMAALLEEVAGAIPAGKYRKRRRGPKKPSQKQKSARGAHRSTARVLNERKNQTTTP